MQRGSLRDAQTVNQWENRVIGAVGHESSGSTQTNDAYFLHSNKDLIATNVSSTNQTATNGQSGGTSWQGEWNRLASHATPGTRTDTIVEVYQRPISQKRQHTEFSLSNSLSSNSS
jgi:hypothetical protein